MNRQNVDPSSYIIFHLLLLQLEEYNLGRYLRIAVNTWGHNPALYRKPLVWTLKLKLINFLALLVLLSLSVFLSMIFSTPVIFLITAIGFCYFYFLFIAIAAFLVSPFDSLVKTVIITKAKRKITLHPQLKVIAIAGSYGKTLMKEMVASVLSQQFRVLKTPENINTPMGISRLILDKMTEETQVLVVEMGEYTLGDIRSLCELTPPDIGIITGINEAHLERMGTLETTITTIAELPQQLKPNGILIANGDDQRVKNHIRHAFFYHQSPLSKESIQIKKYHFHPDGNGQTFEVSQNNKTVMYVTLPVLAKYALGNVIAVSHLARTFGMGWASIQKGLNSLKPPPHRLQPIINTASDLIIIDDSYNGNPDGVNAAIEVLSQFKNRRKIYITPGLVEMGHREKKIHIAIGKQLAAVADLVILVHNSVTPFIEEGLKAAKFAKEKIIRYPDAQDLQAKFSHHLRPGDVVLFQNDWPDNYI